MPKREPPPTSRKPIPPPRRTGIPSRKKALSVGGRVRITLTAHDMKRLHDKFSLDGSPPTREPAAFRAWCLDVGVFACDLALEYINRLLEVQNMQQTEQWLEEVANVGRFGWAVEASVVGGMEGQMVVGEGDGRDWADQETVVGEGDDGDGGGAAMSTSWE